jgi:crotonobetainyl-CoA:carnitine CoA-transferase CaiB-like acyl-CoA transferase
MKPTLQHPVAGDIHLPGIPFLLDFERPVPSIPPPMLGQHTEQVLQHVLDMNGSEIRQLREEGVV